jgi:tRNA A-37 threonylcarbamoyl transferase component Bud32
MSKVIAKREKKVVYHEGSKAVKLFDKDFSKSDILNEALNQARVEETGLHIPNIVEITAIDGKWAIIMEYIKGETLESLMEKNPKKLNEYLNFFVDIQLQVQAKRSPRLPYLKDKMNRKVEAAKDVLDATLRYDLHSRIDTSPNQEKICHCDFVPSNIIVTDKNVPYVIDWSHATQGNGECDAALTYLQFFIEGKEKLAQKYLEIFCKKSDTAKQNVQNWMPIAAATKIPLYDGKIKEVLLKFIEVVDGL